MKRPLENQSRQDSKQHLHYVHALEYSTQERIVGLFVLGGLLLLLLALVFNQQSTYLFEDTFTLHSTVSNAEGISTSTRVNAAGLEVGRVSGLEVDESNQIRVTMQLRERFHGLIRADATASLSTLSMFGNTSIDIDGGTPGKDKIADGANISLIEAPTLNALIGQFIPIMQNVANNLQLLTAMNEDGVPLQTVVSDLARITANMRRLSDQLTRQDNLVGRALNDPELGHELSARMADAEAILALMQQRLDETAPLLQDSRQAAAEFPALVQEWREVQREFQMILQAILAEVDQLPGLVDDGAALMREARDTMGVVQQSWPLAGSLREQQAEEQESYGNVLLPPTE